MSCSTSKRLGDEVVRAGGQRRLPLILEYPCGDASTEVSSRPGSRRGRRSPAAIHHRHLHIQRAPDRCAGPDLPGRPGSLPVDGGDHLGPPVAASGSPPRVDVAVIHQQVCVRPRRTALATSGDPLLALRDETRHRIVKTGAGDRFVQYQIHLIRTGRYLFILGIEWSPMMMGERSCCSKARANGQAGLEPPSMPGMIQSSRIAPERSWRSR